ncbi:unnamed protein product [Strongylus vulgaris]|uniref:Uncharacterized protein n=1 Tax=Strongylus vulgaris TaxID=40348 RepID=A0A3P7K4C1_STRVU|nr:unnamed protein product [Strongylus vulgaris]
MDKMERSDYPPMRRANRVGTLDMSAVAAQDPSSPSICRGFVGDPMDRYLAGLGLVKKMMPNDRGSSVYRAVCEGLSGDQSEYLELQQVVEGDLQMRYRLQRLRTGLADVNKIEDTLETISRLLRIELHVYRVVGEEPQIHIPKKRTTKRPDKVRLIILFFLLHRLLLDGGMTKFVGHIQKQHTKGNNTVIVNAYEKL